MTYLRPDAKSQVTIIYSAEHNPLGIDSIVVSTQHDDFLNSAVNGKVAEKQMQQQIRKDIVEILFPRVIKKMPKRFKNFFDKICFIVFS